MAHQHTQPLLQPGHNHPPALPALHPETKSRPHQDVIWSRLYLGLSLGTLAFAAYAFISSQQVYQLLLKDEEYLDDYSNCPTKLLGEDSPHFFISRDPLGKVPNKDITKDDISVFLWVAGLVLVTCLGLAVTVAVIFILLLQHIPGVLVFLTVATQVLLPLAWAWVAYASGDVNTSMLALGFSCFLALCFFLGRAGLELVAVLLGMSARALRDQSGLLFLSWVLNLILPGAWLINGWLTSAVAASGQVLPNPDRKAVTPGGYCVGSDSKTVIPCCLWEPVTYSSQFATIAGIMLLWTTLLLNQIRVYTVAGSISQWYWSQVTLPGQHPTTNSGTGLTVPGATYRSLGHALGSSFGSLCFGSFILFITSLGRMWMTRYRDARERGGTVLGCLVSCFMGCVLELLEQLTKFATVRAAMTGQAFMTASMDVIGLLSRNSMDAYNVWWYPTLVLHLASALLSLSLTWVAYHASLWIWSTQATLAGRDMHVGAVFMAILTGTLSYLMMSFLSSLLLNVIDALWVCYAVDRENRQCYKPQVHQAFSKLQGALVVQPTGDYAYGQQAYGQQPYGHAGYGTHPHPPHPYQAPPPGHLYPPVQNVSGWQTQSTSPSGAYSVSMPPGPPSPQPGWAPPSAPSHAGAYYPKVG